MLLVTPKRFCRFSVASKEFTSFHSEKRFHVCDNKRTKNKQLCDSGLSGEQEAQPFRDMKRSREVMLLALGRLSQDILPNTAAEHIFVSNKTSPQLRCCRKTMCLQAFCFDWLSLAHTGKAPSP